MVSSSVPSAGVNGRLGGTVAVFHSASGAWFGWTAVRLSPREARRRFADTTAGAPALTAQTNAPSAHIPLHRPTAERATTSRARPDPSTVHGEGGLPTVECPTRSDWWPSALGRSRRRTARQQRAL